MAECRFCSGYVIRGKSVGNGIKTFHDMINNMLGKEDEEDLDPDKLCNGIQLKRDADWNPYILADSSAMEYDPVKIGINFCPLCGENLKEED